MPRKPADTHPSELPRMKPCLHCRQPLDAREPYWIVRPPDEGEHHSCRATADATPYPLESQIEALRTLARRVGHLHREVIRVGKRLTAWQRAWPKGRVDIVRTAESELAKLRTLVR